jgi:hypothetical protein
MFEILLDFPGRAQQQIGARAIKAECRSIEKAIIPYSEKRLARYSD